jgi:competence protein ComEA
MNTGRRNNGWALAVILPALIIIAGGLFIFIRLQSSPGVEIALKEPAVPQGSIYVSGAVNIPGIYAFYDGDTLEDIVLAAGGIKDGADLTMIELSIDSANTGDIPQKVNLNRAEAWLLEALPGIGEVKAQAIIEYRQRNGLIHDIDELLNIPGFGETNLKDIEGCVTVYD